MKKIIIIFGLLISGCNTTTNHNEVVETQHSKDIQFTDPTNLTDEEIIQRLELQLMIEDFLRDLEKSKEYRLKPIEKEK